MSSPNQPPVVTSQREENRAEVLLEKMRETYGIDSGTVSIVRAPLRICPLGAHIDHQLGVVTGMTIDRALLVAFAPTDDGTVEVNSVNFPSSISFNINRIPPYVAGDWGNYVRGAALALRQDHPLRHGFVGWVDGEMPIGGLSSSAAVTVAYLLALETVNGLSVTPHQNIALVSRTEQDYIGLRNGILDQSSILFSQDGALTCIDCRDQAIKRIKSPGSDLPAEIMVVYSGVDKNLVGSSYNNRVAECQEAARLLLAQQGQVVENPRLRHVDPSHFEEARNSLPEILHRRASHFFGEMSRVADGMDAWQRGDICRFGELITESGESSVHRYESGCPQLITLYETLRDTPGVLGNRFSGAGFRGNCIALIDPAARESIAEAVHRVYPKAFPAEARSYSIHYCRTNGPASLL